MTIIDKANKFFEFEAKIIDQFPLWDTVRHDLFCLYVYNEPFLNNITYNRNIFTFILRLINSIYMFPKIKNSYLFLAASRYKNEEGKFFDPNILDILDNLNERKVIIETYSPDKKQKYETTSNAFLSVFLRIGKKKYKHEAKKYIPENFITQFNLFFNLNVSEKFLCERICIYLISKKYYQILFLNFRPKAIFFIQNGIQRALINAAKEYKIPVIELQHGIFDTFHPAYHYPSFFNTKNVFAPDYLFVYSDFWTKKINFPGCKIITMGNSYLSTEVIKEKNILYDCVIVSNNSLTKIFDVFLSKLLNSGFMGKICYKLHPEQQNEYQMIAKQWVNYPQVEVVLLNKSLITIFNQTNAVLCVRSTAVYEALNRNIKVLFYTKNEDYLTQSDVFNEKNVYIVSDINDFIEILKLPIEKESNSIRYFEPFMKKKFHEFMRGLKNNN